MISFEKMIFWDGWYRGIRESIPDWARAERTGAYAPSTELWSCR